MLFLAPRWNNFDQYPAEVERANIHSCGLKLKMIRSRPIDAIVSGGYPALQTVELVLTIQILDLFD